MTRIQIARLALAALALATAALAAQPPDEGGAAPVTSQAPEQAGPGDDAATTDSAAGKPPGPTRSPGDYRASEKISEDLPVSFPVDI